MAVTSNITLEDARIGFKNFSGKEGQYNPAGRRNFMVFLNHEDGQRLQEDGWNIRWLKPREEGDEPQAGLSVQVEFSKGRPPKVVQITSQGKTVLDESTINILDWADIESCDIIIRPYNWELADGRKGVKAYLSALYVTIKEDEFEKKYYNVPDSAAKMADEPLPFD